ncbi:hypothetical protein CDAR_615611 [Caerostris darwini]|uniref:Uncharacterized protein n=1 Tax=Caerostris darwini TaxID=1538125 RepID=A0AAV4RWW0_9ARAC|nr:hypothetical protein CDAR_615611 [Caerostris darwini]
MFGLSSAGLFQTEFTRKRHPAMGLNRRSSSTPESVCLHLPETHSNLENRLAQASRNGTHSIPDRQTHVRISQLDEISRQHLTVNHRPLSPTAPCPRTAMPTFSNEKKNLSQDPRVIGEQPTRHPPFPYWKNT